MSRDLKSTVILIVSFVLTFLAVLYLLAAVYNPVRIIISSFLILLIFVILTFYQKSKKAKIEITQEIELPSGVELEELKCPYCGASIDPNRIQIIDGIPTVRCKYCGRSFQIVEEPKW